MAQLTLGKFFSGVSQKRKSDGESKKIYELKRGRKDLLIHGSNGHCRLHSSALNAYMALENSG